MSPHRTRVEKNAQERDAARRCAAQPAADPGKPKDRSWDSHNAGPGGEGLSNGYGGSRGQGTGPSGPESKPRTGGAHGRRT